MKREGVSAADSREILHPPGEGVQFTPFGLFGLDQSTPAAGADAMAGAAVPETAPAPQHDFRRPSQQAAFRTVERFAATAAQFDASPRGVVKAAKARAKAIRAELKNMKALQRELAELERLIAAAKKPLAAVRDIRRSAG